MPFRKKIPNIHTNVAAVTLALFLSIGQTHAAPIKTDFVFMIDATSSMGGEIAGVRAGFSSFVGSLNAATVDARYAVVVFGGAPELTLDFTSNGTAAQTALNNITIGANAGIYTLPPSLHTHTNIVHTFTTHRDFIISPLGTTQQAKYTLPPSLHTHTNNSPYLHHTQRLHYISIRDNTS